MIKIEVEQGSPRWHAIRNGESEFGRMISASLISSVLQENPYEPSHRLFEYMVGLKERPDISKSPHIMRGVHGEQEVSDWVTTNTGVLGMPVVGVSERHPFLMASFDWYDDVAGINEIKRPGEKVFERAKQQGAPVYYLAQLDQQMIVSDGQHTESRLVLWHPGLQAGEPVRKGFEPLIFERRLTAEREDRILQAAQDFLARVERYLDGDLTARMIADPKETAWARRYKAGGDPNVICVQDDLFPDDLTEWDAKMADLIEKDAIKSDLEKQLKSVKAQYDKTVKELVALKGDYKIAEDAKTGARLSTFDTEGSVDWKAVAEELAEGEIAPKLMDKHRRAGRSGVRVTLPKPQKSEGTKAA